MSIAGWVHQRADSDRVALRFEGEAVTYAALAHRIDSTVAGLVEAGAGPGDRVGYCGLNRIEVFEALFACARLGAIFVPFNNRLIATELAAQIDDSEPMMLLASDGFHTTLEAAAGGRVVRDLDAEPFAREPELRADVSLPAFVDRGGEPVLMVYTSGTTGRAKGAMLSHDAMLHTVLNGIDQQSLTASDCIIAPLPTFHVGGLNIQTLPTLYVGGEVLLQRRFDPGQILALIAEHRVTQTLLVPAMLSAVSSHPDFGSTDLSNMRGINSGSSIVPAEVMQPFFDRGVPVGQVYGTTETGPTAVVLGYEEAAANIGSCGRAALHTELRIVDEHDGDVSPGEPGELWLRGPNVFSGYWKDPAATAAAFAEGRWFRTGDVGYREPDGHVYISDRIKDVVISGGENVYPAELEPILAEHPAVAEVAVIGRSDQRWGEIPVAVIVVEEGASVSIEQLREWCEGRLAHFKHPRDVVVVDELPRTALGKVQKHRLRAQVS